MVLATYCNVLSSILETGHQGYDAEILDCSIFPNYGEMFGKVDSGHSILRGLCIQAIEYDRTFPEVVGRNLPRFKRGCVVDIFWSTSQKYIKCVLDNSKHHGIHEDQLATPHPQSSASFDGEKAIPYLQDWSN